MEMKLPSAMIERMEKIYADMEASYDRVANALDFSCSGCNDNCCDSYFLHYTYIEWSYLWLGIRQLPEAQQQRLVEKAHHYVVGVEKALQAGRRPQIMCPLNEDGLCLVYKHRLMVCRSHGVPAQMTRPDGKVIDFPGCFRCQEKIGGNEDPPRVERTTMLGALARLEGEFLENRRSHYPRVKMTIAEMLVKGPPKKPYSF